MNQHPVVLLDPVFKWLDRLIAEHGHHLYMALVYASIPLIGWILSGGLRRKDSRQSHIAVIVIRPPVQPPPLPPVVMESNPPSYDDGTESFAM